MGKKTVLVDFDGVIHKYGRGWDDGTAYDEPMEGAVEGLERLSDEFEVVIFTTREVTQVVEWLEKYGFPVYEVTNHKRPAVCIIDDRAIRFTNWEETYAAFDALYGQPT